MKRYICLILLVILLAVVGCEAVEAASVDDEFRIKRVYSNPLNEPIYVFVLTDVYTGVEYLVVYSAAGTTMYPRLDGTETMSSYLKLR